MDNEFDSLSGSTSTSTACDNDFVRGGGSGNRGRWTKREKAVFVEGLRKFGKEWRVITKLIQTRSIVQVRTHAQKYFQQLAKVTGGPVMSTSNKPRTSGEGAVANANANSGNNEFSPSSPLIINSRLAAATSSAGSKRASKDTNGSTSPSPSCPSSSGRKRKLAETVQEMGGNAGYNLRKNPKASKSRRMSFTELCGSEAGYDTDKSGMDKPLFVPRLSIPFRAQFDDEDCGALTPRMVAAATILAAPKLSSRFSIAPSTMSWANAMLSP